MLGFCVHWGFSVFHPAANRSDERTRKVRVSRVSNLLRNRPGDQSEWGAAGAGPLIKWPASARAQPSEETAFPQRCSPRRALGFLLRSKWG